MFDQDAYGTSVFANAVNRAVDLAPPYDFVGLNALGNYDREATESGLFSNRGSFGAVRKPGVSRPTRIRRMRVLSGFGAASGGAANPDTAASPAVWSAEAAVDSQTQTGEAVEEESFFAKNKTYIVAGVAGLAAVGLLFMVAKKKR